MSNNPLDLNGLTMDNIDFSSAQEGMARLNKIEEEYKKQYGDDWWEHYKDVLFPPDEYDPDEKSINNAIYKGRTLCLTGDPESIRYMENKYVEKMKRLFGRFYKLHISHKPNDPKVNKLLIKDAFETGMWKELPECLQKDYHEYVRTQNGQ